MGRVRHRRRVPGGCGHLQTAGHDVLRGTRAPRTRPAGQVRRCYECAEPRGHTGNKDDVGGAGGDAAGTAQMSSERFVQLAILAALAGQAAGDGLQRCRPPGRPPVAGGDQAGVRVAGHQVPPGTRRAVVLRVGCCWLRRRYVRGNASPGGDVGARRDDGRRAGRGLDESGRGELIVGRKHRGARDGQLRRERTCRRQSVSGAQMARCQQTDQGVGDAVVQGAARARQCNWQLDDAGVTRHLHSILVSAVDGFWL